MVDRVVVVVVSSPAVVLETLVVAMAGQMMVSKAV